MNIALNMELHANQELIHASGARNVVVMAGKRFGKTKLACYKICQWAGMRPGGTFIYLADTYAHAKNISWKELKNLLPPQVIKRVLENELEITLINDSLIKLMGAENEEGTRGIKMHGAVFEEAAYMNPYVWNNIVRGQLLDSSGEPGPAFFISSPVNPFRAMGSTRSDWYSKFFEDALRKKNLGDKDWDAFHFTIYDNPLLRKSDIDEIRADSTEDEFNVEYLARPSAHAGTIYSEFDFSRHVMECPSVGKYVRAIDWGIDHPTVCLFAHVDNATKKVYIEDEYSQSGFTIEESVEVIKKKTKKDVDWTVCDPSLNKRNSQTKRTDKQEFDRLGVFCMPGDNNHRGYNIVKMFLKKDVIRINPKCKNLIKELKSLQWSDKTNDDMADALRYLCVRVHDMMFNWKDLPVVEEKKLSPGQFSLYDPFLFGKKVHENNMIDQLRVY